MGPEGEIAILQKISEKMDDAKLISASSVLSNIFCKVAFGPSGPSKNLLGGLSPA